MHWDATAVFTWAYRYVCISILISVFQQNTDKNFSEIIQFLMCTFNFMDEQ